MMMLTTPPMASEPLLPDFYALLETSVAVVELMCLWRMNPIEHEPKAPSGGSNMWRNP